MTWVERDGDGVRLRVRVQPRASRTAVTGVVQGSLRVSLAAPPVDGAANEALIRFLAKDVLGIAPSRVRLVRGDTAREKLLFVDGVTVDEICGLLPLPLGA